MPALRYHLRDSTGTIREHSAEEVGQLLAESKKPVVFTCLGMDGFSGKTHPESQIKCVEGFFPGHKRDEFHVISVTSGETKFTDTQIRNYIHKFNDRIKANGSRRKPEPIDYHAEYENPSSFGMQLLKEAIGSSIPSVTWMNDGERDQAVQQAKNKLSQYNFFGHSFGTIIIAEAMEHMQAMLQDKGFTAKEIDECMHCMGRLNVGNSYHVTEQHAQVPGIEYNSALDRIAVDHKNIPDPMDRDSSVALMERVGNSLKFSPLVGSDTVDTARIKATDDADDDERRTFTSKVSRGANGPQAWTSEIVEVSDRNTHALPLYMYSENMHLDPEHGRGRFTSQAFPGAEVVNGYMRDLMESSLESARTGRERNTSAIIDGLESKLATPEARDALAVSLQTVQDRFNGAISPQDIRR